MSAAAKSLDTTIDKTSIAVTICHKRVNKIIQTYAKKRMSLRNSAEVIQHQFEEPWIVLWLKPWRDEVDVVEGEGLDLSQVEVLEVPLAGDDADELREPGLGHPHQSTHICYL